jgi:hypothetical protein
MNEREKREHLAELAGLAHARELELYLSELENRFREWRQGTISSTELSDLIHEFHDGSARAVYSTYTQMKREEVVARAIGVGLLREEEVPSEIREPLEGLVSHFRHTYQIDEHDPLARLRSQGRLAGTDRDAQE